MQNNLLEILAQMQQRLENTASYVLSQQARLIEEAQAALDVATAHAQSGAEQDRNTEPSSSAAVSDASQRVLDLQNREYAWKKRFQDLQDALQRFRLPS